MFVHLILVLNLYSKSKASYKSLNPLKKYYLKKFITTVMIPILSLCCAWICCVEILCRILNRNQDGRILFLGFEKEILENSMSFLSVFLILLFASPSFPIEVSLRISISIPLFTYIYLTRDIVLIYIYIFVLFFHLVCS